MQPLHFEKFEKKVPLNAAQFGDVRNPYERYMQPILVRSAATNQYPSLILSAGEKWSP